MKFIHFCLICIIFFTWSAKGQVSTEIWQSILENHAQKKGSSDYTSYIITHSHQSRPSKVYHVYLKQKYDDVLITDSDLSIHVTESGHLLRVHDRFFHQLETKIEPIAVIIPVAQCIENIWRDLGYPNIQNWSVLSVDHNKPHKTILRAPGQFLGDTKAELRYIEDENKRLILVWEINFETLDGKENWLVHARADNGRVVRSRNQVIQCNFSKSDQPSTKKPFFPGTRSMPNPLYQYRVFPLKVESPSHGNRVLVTNPGDTTASPYNWHDFDGVIGEDTTATKGNNVEAREDKDGNNATLGEMADGGENLVFDFPFNPLAHPHINQNASITNLFYWNNIIHDIIYHYGFDEPSGNFQTHNYGNGGLANDHVQADAMDGEGYNNANFFTPVDGASPRMQMFLWNGPYNLTANAPPPVQGNYPFAKAAFGPTTFSVTANVVLADDGTPFPTRACNPLINGSQISGKIAMVDNGDCLFGLKCRNAQLAGAIAVIVCNDVPGSPYIMPNDQYSSSIIIPCIMMRKQDCDSIKIYLNSGVNMTMLVGEATDGDYDNGIICHEYGHGISTRLTGGAGVNNCLFNEEQMGEGWSDWYGLMLTMEDDDVESRERGIGTYALNQPIDGIGIRTYHYSTDMAVNPHTYNSIMTEAVPHGVGSVWCVMLWELTWALIREHGYDPDFYRGTGGNNIVMALVTEALKLQPCSPGFVDARNAILLADSVLYDGANSCLIWKSFAKRGLGIYADQGLTSSRSDGTQSFEMPRTCCLQVSNTLDSGVGSLRDALDCATTGDTITFLNFIKDDTIQLTSGALQVFREVTIQKPSSWNLAIKSNDQFPVFQMNTGAILENLRLISGTGGDVRALHNLGNSTLKNVDILDPLANSNNGRTILNNGNIQVIGGVEIRKD